ncbi:MAG: threonine--tRNA ligase [Negativicutes bacterium]|nr:threonine--tRNA ligase [Negativicutes bacterium]
MIRIQLKNGSELELEEGANCLQAAKKISSSLAKEVLAAEVNGCAVDLNTELRDGDRLNLWTFHDEEGKHIMRHSGAHLLAQAVKRLYPAAKPTIGPAVENGFYYDFDMDTTISGNELAGIEAEMLKIVKENLPIRRFALPRREAIALMQEREEPYKVELIENLPEGEEISFYQQGEYVDLCVGPHVPSTGVLKAFKLTAVTGAYWHGDANNKMLQRIYGVVYPKKADLDAYLTMLEEAKKRDHRKLGRELDLFMLADEGPGFPFFLPKGMILRNLLIDFWREVHHKAGYQEISTPIILNESLWHQSGHWDHYKENMYFTTIDEQTYAIKPMNCPGGILAFKRKAYSYRDLPQRLGELGIVHRHELSGALHGLMRVRCFTQDDAHIFMTPDQMESEIISTIRLIDSIYRVFGFEYHMELSTRPQNSMGSDEQWEAATGALRNALESNGQPYKLNEGDGAFYGPKIDFHLKDCLGRTWQCGTIQLDMQMPELFDISYIAPDGEKHRPVMIHRTALGSIERFLGILIEHYAGAFPTWLAPVQAIIMQITDKNLAYAKEIYQQLDQAGYRVELDARNEKIGYKIREAQLQKIPYMLILGDKEMEDGSVSVRLRKTGETKVMTLLEFMAMVSAEVTARI